MSNREKSSNKLATRTWTALPVLSAPFSGVWAGAALITIVTFIAYLPSINGGFVWDDDLLLTNNDLIKSPDGLDLIWCSTEAKDYWPGTNTSFWIEWRLWEMNPAGYHVSNMILHVAECLLIWIILRKLSIPGAFLAAAVFALHPVNVESVAWISQRKNTMAMLFFLLSILWYVKGMQHAAGKVAPGRLEGAGRETASGIIHHSSFIPHPSSFYWLSLAAFVMAMLSKGSVAVLPLLLLGITWWLRPLMRWDFVLSIPFFAVAAVLSGANVWFQTHGSGEVIRTASFAERLVGAGGAIWFYIYKAIFPIDLSPIYRQWRINALSGWWWLPLAAAFAVTTVLWAYRKGTARPLAFAWGFFCIALAPALGFTDVLFMRYSLVADRYQHIAIIGIITLAAAGFAAFYERAGGGMKRGAAIALATVALAALGLLAWRQNGCYSDEIALYRATLQKNPDCCVVRYDLGYALVQKGRPEEMIEQFEKALQLDPDFREAHNGLGAILARMGRSEEAIEHFLKALKEDPGYIEARINLGAAWLGPAASTRPSNSTGKCCASAPATAERFTTWEMPSRRRTGSRRPSIVSNKRPNLIPIFPMRRTIWE